HRQRRALGWRVCGEPVRLAEPGAEPGDVERVLGREAQACKRPLARSNKRRVIVAAEGSQGIVWQRPAKGGVILDRHVLLGPPVRRHLRSLGLAIAFTYGEPPFFAQVHAEHRQANASLQREGSTGISREAWAVCNRQRRCQRTWVRSVRLVNSAPPRSN